MKRKDRTKTMYCEYYNICKKDINCFEGEYCSQFKHNRHFTSLRFVEDEDVTREYPDVYEPLCFD